MLMLLSPIFASAGPLGTVSVTVGNSGSLYGFESGSYGSASGDLDLLDKGTVISIRNDLTSGADFFIRESSGAGPVLTGEFSRLVIETAGGNITLDRADGTESQNPGVETSIRWGTGSSPVWGASDNGLVRTITIY